MEEKLDRVKANIFPHRYCSIKHLLSDLCNNEACSNSSCQAAATLELPKAVVINTMLVPKLLSLNSV